MITGTPRMDAAKLRAILPGVPLVESPFFDEIVAASDFDAETARVAKDLNRDGFAVLRFPDAEFDARAERIKQNLSSHFDFAAWRTEGWKHGGLRVQDAWTFDPDVRALAVNPRLIKILSDIFGRKAWPFQTLNFPVGSQQPYHSDSVHFSSIPERFMCGVWVALEDVSEGAGPLEYYPGSHKWPILYNDQIGVRITRSKVSPTQVIYHDVWQALVEKTGVKRQLFFPRKGDTLIWAPNLLHGGSSQSDLNATRWSQVTHYFFEDCCYITPMQSDVLIGKLKVRNLTDIATGAPVTNVYIDAKLYDLVPPPWRDRLAQRLRHPVQTVRNAFARLGRLAAHYAGIPA
jgi:Phytanoyl-CoA dioxygenase (PhyH)